MAKKKNEGYVVSQIRIPEDLSKYMSDEAKRMGITKNTFMIVLLQQGKAGWDQALKHPPTKELEKNLK